MCSHSLSSSFSDTDAQRTCAVAGEKRKLRRESSPRGAQLGNCSGVQRTAPGVETSSPRARRSASERNERQISHANPAGMANTIESMNRMLVFRPSASEPFWEATASLQLSQA